MRFWHWLKKWWWVVMIAIGTALGFLLGFRVRKETDGGKSPPDFVEKAKAQKEILEAQAAVERIKVKAEADVGRARLDEIGKIEDVRVRRWRLAEFMKGL